MTNIQSLITRIVYRMQYHNEPPTLELLKDLEEMVDDVTEMENFSIKQIEEIKAILS